MTPARATPAVVTPDPAADARLVAEELGEGWEVVPLSGYRLGLRRDGDAAVTGPWQLVHRAILALARRCREQREELERPRARVAEMEADNRSYELTMQQIARMGGVSDA